MTERKFDTLSIYACTYTIPLTCVSGAFCPPPDVTSAAADSAARAFAAPSSDNVARKLTPRTGGTRFNPFDNACQHSADKSGDGGRARRGLRAAGEGGEETRGRARHLFYRLGDK